MSHYSVSIGGREYKVRITDACFLVDGEPVKFELVSLNAHGLHLFRHGHKTTEMYVGASSGGVYEVLVSGRRVIAQVDPAHRRQHRGEKQLSAGDLLTPMPGLVVAVPVQEGEWVVKGQLLVVLESMKMQMQLRAPFAGCVTRIAVGVGTQVEKATLLVKVTASPHETMDVAQGSSCSEPATGLGLHSRA